MAKHPGSYVGKSSHNLKSKPAKKKKAKKMHAHPKKK